MSHNSHTGSGKAGRDSGASPKPHWLGVTLLIFVSGAVLMALGITGSRVLAPAFAHKGDVIIY
jgi:hypothetical protein